MSTKNSKYSVKRHIYSNEFNEDDFQMWAKDMRDINDYDEDEISEDTMRQWYYDDLDENLDIERANLDKDIDGYIIALGSRWSHYGAICGNGRTGVAMCGTNLSDIFTLTNDLMEFWGQNYNIQGRTADHDGSWSFTYRVCKSEEEADKFMEKGYDSAEIMARTKSLYPYVAEVYGWPYRGSKRA